MKPLLDSEDQPLFVLYRISNDSVLRAYVRWPRPDGRPIDGLDADLLWLPMRVEDEPQFDPHYFTASQHGSYNEAENSWDIAWEIEKRPQSEILATVAEHREQKLNETIDPARTRELALMGLAIFFRKSGVSLDAAEQVIAGAIIAAADEARHVAERGAALEAAIRGGAEPDILTAWVK